MPRLVFENLTKVFREPKGRVVRAVDGLSFTVESGEFLVLTGPSGCGKTTTLRLLAGLEEPTSGTIYLDGKSMNGVSPRQRDVAMVFQNSALYPHMSARENIAFGLKLRKCPRAEIEQRVNAAAEMLGLTNCLDRRPQELSGGQRQRVALGRALVRRPRLFLFDEPLANLDPQLRLQMRAEISRLHRRLASADALEVSDPAFAKASAYAKASARQDGAASKGSMIYVTHDHLEAMAMGQRIAVMKDGKIQQLAAPMELYQHPANLFVAGFIGSPPMNFFKGTIVTKNGSLAFQENGVNEPKNGPSDPGALDLGLQPHSATPASPHATQLADFLHKPVVLGIRPEDIGIAGDPESAAGGHLAEAYVEVVEQMGAETYVQLRGGNNLFTARLAATERVETGRRVRLHFQMSRALVFDLETGKAIN